MPDPDPYGSSPALRCRPGDHGFQATESGPAGARSGRHRDALLRPVLRPPGPVDVPTQLLPTTVLPSPRLRRRDRLPAGRRPPLPRPAGTGRCRPTAPRTGRRAGPGPVCCCWSPPCWRPWSAPLPATAVRVWRRPVPRRPLRRSQPNRPWPPHRRRRRIRRARCPQRRARSTPSRSRRRRCPSTVMIRVGSNGSGGTGSGFVLDTDGPHHDQQPCGRRRRGRRPDHRGLLRRRPGAGGAGRPQSRPTTWRSSRSTRRRTRLTPLPVGDSDDVRVGRAGRGDRLTAGARQHRHPGHRQCQEPTGGGQRRRRGRLAECLHQRDPDRCRHQPGQLRRTVGRCRRPGDRGQLGHPDARPEPRHQPATSASASPSRSTRRWRSASC